MLKSVVRCLRKSRVGSMSVQILKHLGDTVGTHARFVRREKKRWHAESISRRPTYGCCSLSGTKEGPLSLSLSKNSTEIGARKTNRNKTAQQLKVIIIERRNLAYRRKRERGAECFKPRPGIISKTRARLILFERKREKRKGRYYNSLIERWVNKKHRKGLRYIWLLHEY